MRPSLLPSRAAAVVVTAAALAAPTTAHAADAVYGGTTKDGDAIVVKADKDGTELRSLVISWAADCANGMRYSGNAVLTPTKPVPGFSPGGSDLLISRNAMGKFAGTQLDSDNGAGI